MHQHEKVANHALDLEVEFGHEDQPYIQSNRYQYNEKLSSSL